MTKEDKDLLLKDICARLPYGVICEHNGEIRPLYGVSPQEHYAIKLDNLIDLDNPIDATNGMECCKVGDYLPYLRPMSSMTKEEKNERNFYCGYKPYYEEEDCGESYLTEYDMPDYMDFLLEHHFDFRGLIKKGLALEAPEGMYETE